MTIDGGRVGGGGSYNTYLYHVRLKRFIGKSNISGMENGIVFPGWFVQFIFQEVSDINPDYVFPF